MDQGDLHEKIANQSMRIGVPREVKDGEARVGIDAAGLGARRRRIDQGGIAETSRMTQLFAPTYIDEGVIHYCVPNMPALVPRTATLALAGATLPYVRVMAARGIQQALDEDPGLRAGMQVSDGRITHAGLAADAAASRNRA